MLRTSLRQRALPLAALSLALLGLLAQRHHARPTVQVLVAARTVAADRGVTPADLRLVSIDAADRTPSMLTRVDEAAFRVAHVALRPGDYVLRGALQSARQAPLRPGERAFSLRLDAAAAP